MREATIKIGNYQQGKDQESTKEQRIFLMAGGASGRGTRPACGRGGYGCGAASGRGSGQGGQGSQHSVRTRGWHAT